MAFDTEADTPPLPAWPPEVFDHEPAHGLFKRIASANRQISTRTLAAHVGLNGRNVNPEEMLDFCRRFPLRCLDKLDVATPKADGKFVTVCTQIFRRRYWLIGQSRVCAACVAESPYHRTWFDFALLRQCPIHHEPLVDSVDGQKLAAWVPSIGVTATGEVARTQGTAHPSSDGLSWERYVLGRMGIVIGFCVPWLDGSELYEVADVAGIIGGLLHACANKQAAPGLKVATELALHVGTGFDVLARGERAIDDVLRHSLQSNDAGMSALLQKRRSWLGYRLQQLSRGTPRSLLRRAMRNVAVDEPRPQPKPKVRSAGESIPLAEAAEALGMSYGRARRFAVRLGIVPERSSWGASHVVTPKAISKMRNVLSRLVPRKDAAAVVGISDAQFDYFCSERKIEAFVHFGRASNECAYFLPEDLSRLAAAPAVANLKSHEVKGSFGASVGGLTFTDAATTLGVPLRAISTLVAGGLLSRCSGLKPNARPRVTAASVAEFGETFVPASSYATLLECEPMQVSAKLRKMGIDPVPVPGLRHPVLYKRSDVRADLGIPPAADQQPLSQEEELWQKVRARFLKSGSRNRLVTISGPVATVTTGDRKTTVSLTAQMIDRRIVLELVADRERSPRRLRVLEGCLMDLIAAWPTGEVHGSVEEGEIRIREQLPISSLASVRTVDGVVDWVEDRMAVMRAIFVYRHPSKVTDGKAKLVLTTPVCD